MSEEKILTAVISSAAAMSCMFREISENFVADASFPSCCDISAAQTSIPEKS